MTNDTLLQLRKRHITKTGIGLRVAIYLAVPTPDKVVVQVSWYER
jgi:hypothetical protein